MVLSEGVLGIRRREYELERQASAHDLDSSRGQLAYLSTLVKEGWVRVRFRIRIRQLAYLSTLVKAGWVRVSLYFCRFPIDAAPVFFKIVWRRSRPISSNVPFV